ncbi:kinase-like domain-containing protein [Tanacetum coccineum]
MSSSIQNLDHLKIPLEDILEATNHFSNENFIRQGGFGKIYKGKLERYEELIDIVARRLDDKYGQGSKEFLTEVTMLSSLKHENLVSIVGFCDKKNEEIVINKYEAKGSLDNYLSDPNLTWLQRLQICVGVARALNYIHYDEARCNRTLNWRDMKLAQVAKSHYEKRQLEELIDPDSRKQMNQESFDIFSEAAYNCLKEQRAERPSIDQIVIILRKR